MNITRQHIALLIMTLMAMVSSVIIYQAGAIPQDLDYHNFADSRDIFKVPNFLNVVSNLGFLLVGAYALYKIYIVRSLLLVDEIRVSYIIFFVATILVSFGSSYYHLEPNNESLVWDRLPMTIAFMSLFSFVISEFISIRVGKVVLYPLLLLGIASVAYWFFGEMQGVGDLRAYILIQYLPMIILPIIIIFFNSQFSLVMGYWMLLLCYLVAKLFEHFDSEIFTLLGFISGHSLKHMLSALGIFILIRSFEKRYIVSQEF